MALGGGNKQFVLVINHDFGRKSWTIPLSRKINASENLEGWIVIKENQSGKRVKKVRSDNGREYIEEELLGSTSSKGGTE